MATDCRWWYRWEVAVWRSSPVVQSIVLCIMEVFNDMSSSVVMDGGWVGTVLCSTVGCICYVGAACGHGVDQFTNCTTVRNFWSLVM